jgi:tetratricopeptide (TPR) repeat protein
MSTYFKFWILYAITGSPLASIAILLVLGAVADWYSLGFLRRGYRFVHNIRRGFRLSAEIEVNPANRKARFDLGEILVEQHRYSRAIEVLKPVLEENPDDLPALFVMGLACLGAGRVEQGELFLGTVEQADPTFRHGAVPLELGRYRHARGADQQAVEAFRRFLQAYPASVEGHYLLSRALADAGDSAAARQERNRAWHEYKTSLPYQRRMDRLWAWRARPSRPAIYAVLLVTLFAATGYVMSHANLSSLRSPYGRSAAAPPSGEVDDR